MKKEHLPVFGVGPFCGISMLLFFIVGALLSHFGYLDSGKIPAMRIPLIVIGVLLIALGVFIWVQAVIISKIDKAVVDNKLLTTGIYAWVRNPIYSAIAIALTGLALLFSNLWLLLLPVIYWLDITILMKNTEEKWLTEQYGQEYIDYCKQVNRCIPWFPKRKNK